jgi:hypothetical protein
MRNTLYQRHLDLVCHTDSSFQIQVTAETEYRQYGLLETTYLS